MTDQPNLFRVLDITPRSNQASKPSELIQIRGHQALSLNARRAITILWHNAHRQGVSEGKDYTIALSELVPTKHKGYETIVEAIEALMTTLIVIRNQTGDTTRVQILGGNNLSSKNRPSGTLTYRFDKALVEILRDSRIWGKISLPELTAFTSKYTISLYEHVSQWSGLEHKHMEHFTLDEFRGILGVEPGKHRTFGQLNQHVLKPVEQEINALAPFNISVVPLKTGRKVTDIRLHWWQKSVHEKKLAYQELNRSRVGRRARITGAVDNVVSPDDFFDSDDP